MTQAVSPAHGHAHVTHARPANFGQLNSAIKRGDMAAAQTAFTALSESSAPSAMAAKARGSLEAVGAAIAAGDAEAARTALDSLRSRTAAALEPTDPATAPAPAPETTLPSAQQILAVMTGTGGVIDTTA